ncbi:MAG: preprotein translocase subunit SecE [Flavobacteriales bacterium]|jgi:preprotein translocase subunit SecE|nr:preprotein translocase subunit SecE [Flavobacteriales bacterium]MBT6747224.1 preprotein translocase subunit SecE [Flavobacteriales bacterium]
MAGFITYIEEVVDELKNKTSWPTWAELQSSSLIVLVATFITAAIIFGMDSGFKILISDGVYSFFK